MTALADQRHAADSQPIPSEYLAAVSSWLGNSGRDRTGAMRHDVAVLRASLYPNSARARFSLGMSASARNDSSLARTHLTEALRLLPGDSDPLLDVATRERIERQALQRRLLLSLYGLGTNTGLKRITAGQPDDTYQDLIYVRRRFITRDALRAALPKWSTPSSGPASQRSGGRGRRLALRTPRSSGPGTKT